MSRKGRQRQPEGYTPKHDITPYVSEEELTEQTGLFSMLKAMERFQSDILVQAVDSCVEVVGDKDMAQCEFTIDEEESDGFDLDRFLQEDGPIFVYEGHPRPGARSADRFKIILQVTLKEERVQCGFPAVCKIAPGNTIYYFDLDIHQWRFSEDMQALYDILRKDGAEADFVWALCDVMHEHPLGTDEGWMTSQVERYRKLCQLGETMSSFAQFEVLFYGDFAPVLLPADEDRWGSAVSLEGDTFVLYRLLPTFLFEDEEEDIDDEDIDESYWEKKAADDYYSPVYKTEDAGEIFRMARTMWDHFNRDEAVYYTVPLSSDTYAEAKEDTTELYLYDIRTGAQKSPDDLTEEEDVALEEMQAILDRLSP